MNPFLIIPEFSKEAYIDYRKVFLRQTVVMKIKKCKQKKFSHFQTVMNLSCTYRYVHV